VVAAPTQLHYAIVKDALLAGRHVLCEKPLCVEVNEAVELVELARRQRLILMVGHVFLFNPGIVRLKELVQAGEPGRIYYLRALRTNLGPVRRDVNSVFDLATHDISIFNYLLNAAPESVSATGGKFIQHKLEDVASISLHYPNNVLAHILVSWLDPKKLREIVVVGDKKMLTWDDLAPIGPIMIYDKGLDCPPDYADYGQFQLLMREGDITIPRVKLEEPLKKQNQFFLQCIREARLPMNDGAFAVNVVRVLQAVTESLQRQSQSVPVRL
jgi:predicted dehydrogenase